jgi:hypothetical protein
VPRDVYGLKVGGDIENARQMAWSGGIEERTENVPSVPSLLSQCSQSGANGFYVFPMFRTAVAISITQILFPFYFHY